MSKHTPGPWSFWSGYNPWDKIEAQVTAENGDIIIANYNHHIEDGEANAALMAAAPDLLTAIEGLMKCFDDGVGEEWSAKELDAARVAIAKAKGEPA